MLSNLTLRLDLADLNLVVVYLGEVVGYIDFECVDLGDVGIDLRFVCVDLLLIVDRKLVDLDGQS